MSSDAPDSVFKLHLAPTDTAQDVYQKFNAAVENIKSTPLDSDFDNTARALTLIPGVFLKFYGVAAADAGLFWLAAQIPSGGQPLSRLRIFYLHGFSGDSRDLSSSV